MYAIGVRFGLQMHGWRSGILVAHGALGKRKEAALP